MTPAHKFKYAKLALNQASKSFYKTRGWDIDHKASFDKYNELTATARKALHQYVQTVLGGNWRAPIGEPETWNSL